MALAKVNDILKMADKGGYAVIGFDAFNLESIKMIIDEAEAIDTPVILMIYPTMKKIMPYSTFAAVTRDLAAKAKIPVGLMLDHGPDFNEVMEAVKGGFSSIMIDCSHLEFEENVRCTAEVVKVCHGLGIDVEGELGKVGVAAREEDYTNTDNFTQVDKAIEFVERTGVDALAIAVGTAHGSYVSKPNLDFDRLKEINDALDIPLVLHGGTGVPAVQIQKAVRFGINKLNLATGYNLKMYEVYKKIIDTSASRPRMTDLILASEKEIREFLKDSMNMVRVDRQ